MESWPRYSSCATIAWRNQGSPGSTPRFHTQFAGVAKIVSMRAERFGPSRDSAWIEALLGYVDAMSATINEREAQLTTGTEDSTALPPGVENMVGCERGLFMTIRKLGRLNVLSRDGPRQDTAASACGSPEAPSGGGAESTAKQPGAGSMHDRRGDACGASERRFGGNGFGTTLDDDEAPASATCASPALDDERALFWREWKEARLALQEWRFDAETVAASLPEPPSPGQVQDLRWVSEAFRCAALLYTERLACPRTPSSQAKLRSLVGQVVLYASSLEAGSGATKFLLWPLFVAGSECVDALQQDVVRAKCREMTGWSGYMHSLLALGVLERLWAAEAAGQGLRSKTTGRGGPFTWARCPGGPGAETEWIML